MTEEGRLLRRYIDEKSELAFARLTERYLRLVYGTCLRELRDPALAEDAAQVVFLILARKAHGLRSEAALASWLFTTSRLTARQIRKQENLRRQREQEAFEQSMSEQSIAWLQIAEHVNDAVSSLTPQDREVVLLRFFEGMSLKEIGHICGIPENTAGTRVIRAVGKMRQRLIRDGATITVTALAAALTAEAARALPSSSAAELASHALQQIPGAIPSGASAIGGHSTTLTHSLQQTAYGVARQMAINKIITSLVIVGLGIIFAVVTYTASNHLQGGAWITANGVRKSDAGRNIPGNPNKTMADGAILFDKVQIYKSVHGEYPQDTNAFLHDLLENPKRYSYANLQREKPFSSADSKYSDNPLIRANPAGIVWMVCEKRPDGQPVGSNKPQGTRDVIAYTDLYYHQGVRHSRDKDIIQPIGFYIVVWDNGLVQQIPYYELRYVPVSGDKNNWRIGFPGQAGAKRGYKTYDEIWVGVLHSGI